VEPARLLAEPHRVFHVLDLVAALDRNGNGDVRLPVRLAPGAAPTDVLARAGRTSGTARVAELERELAVAEAAHDGPRALRARAALDHLLAEVAAAAGADRRRGRRATVAVERARVNVTRAVASVVRRIAAQEPALGWVLERAIRTGTYCSYRPSPRRL
jgi:hypothetical protein